MDFSKNIRCRILNSPLRVKFAFSSKCSGTGIISCVYHLLWASEGSRHDSKGIRPQIGTTSPVATVVPSNTPNVYTKGHKPIQRTHARREVYRQAIARLLRGHPTTATGASGVCLDIGDGATCAFLAAGEGASAAVSFEPAEWSHLLVGQVSSYLRYIWVLCEGRLLD